MEVKRLEGTYAVCVFLNAVWRGKYVEIKDSGSALIELVEGPYDGFVCWVSAGRHVPEISHSEWPKNIL